MLLLNFGSSCSGRSISEQQDGHIPLKKKKVLSDFSPVGNSVVGKESSGISALPKP